MQNLRHLTDEQLNQLISSENEKPFRAKQIQEWIWQKGINNISEMSNLPKALREKLEFEYTLEHVEIEESQFSNDGTIKNKFVLHDGYYIEGVLIPANTRMTACVSSQVGCSLTCKFCATGKMERKRNLNFDEIYDQVFILNQQALEHHGHHLSNIVYMGMGEPLLNYNNVLQSIEKITSQSGLGMSPKRITVSTAGIAKKIKQLGDDKVKFNLALSLHAANDAKRNEIMPINESNNLDVLIDAMLHYYHATKNKITFEYILFNNFNDSIEDANDLIKICRKVPSKVNIIEYNPIEFATFIKPDEERTFAFIHHLETNKVTAKLRRSRGKDIDAACGQLANVKK
ncbi:MAG: 23S rRNA (adenine(2503)-C(2))-methyltransferase RlmN [Chitinophagaceae bacterium]|nr:23S rRNA (adenine(2503)-C(2))-methyltransferase RlmN [Chitinophagaceae bacterium]